MKPRIALLLNAFWNNGAGLSGGDQRVIQIFDALASQYEIDIYTSLDGRKIIGARIKGSKVYCAPRHLNRGNLLLTYVRRTAWAKKELLKRQYDIVYGSSDFLPDVVPAAEYKRKYPQVRWVQCIFHYYPNWRHRPGNKLLNIIASGAQQRSFARIRRAADRVININYQVKDALCRDGFDASRIFVNPCGIEISYLEELKTPKMPHVASFIARLNPSKGIFDLPKIWLKVTRAIPQAKLKVVGGGSVETKERLWGEIKKLGLESNIELCGFLSNDEAFRIIKGSEVFVFPSHEEGFGMAIAEAMACDVPAVAWSLPVYKEVFPEGLITVPEGNIDAMAKAVIDLFENKTSAASLAHRAHDFVKRYSWPNIAKTEGEIVLGTLRSK